MSRYGLGYRLDFAGIILVFVHGFALQVPIAFGWNKNGAFIRELVRGLAHE